MSDRAVSDRTDQRGYRLSLPLAHQLRLPVLGVNVLFATNSPNVVDIIEEAFGGWRCVARGDDRDPSVATVRIVVSDAAAPSPESTQESTRELRTSPCAPAPRHYFPDAARIVAFTPGSIGLSDPAQRDAAAVVTPALVADRGRFRETMLEALTFALLSAYDRHPLHAAAIARHDRAVLLAGPSGSGKSTLSHLAHSAGIAVLSEDRVWIQQHPEAGVWGMPGHARLLPKHSIAKTAKITVPLAGVRDNVRNYFARRATVCLLGTVRQAKASLERVSGDTIVRALTDHVDAGFDRFPNRHALVVGALAARGGWRLTLSDDPRDVLPLLETMLDEH